MRLSEFGSEESNMELSPLHNATGFASPTRTSATNRESQFTQHSNPKNKTQDNKESERTAPLQAKTTPPPQKMDEVRKLQPITITQTANPATRAFLEVSQSNQDFKLVDLYV